jgi:MFS family permease
MIILMFGTAITELFTGQWIDVLLKNVTDNAILLLTIETGVMVVGRAFAGPVVHRLAPQGVLLISAILAALGLYLLGHSSGNMLFVGALIFGMGVCYFWPTMIGFVSENLPETGAVGLNFMGAAGMFAVSVYMIFMGGYYDKLQQSRTPAEAGQAIINVTLVIPLVLIVAFAGLFIYMRSKKKQVIQTA